MSGFDFGMEPDEPNQPNTQRAVIVAVVGLLVLILVIGIILAGPIKHLLGGGGDYTGNGTGTVTVVVQPGDSAATIGQTLAKAGVVRSSAAFTDAANLNPKSRNIGPGTYQLHHAMKASLAVALMLNPSSLVDYKVTIPEGFTAAAIVARIVAVTPISAASLEAALHNPTSLGLPAYAAGHVEGFLFPATYDVQPGETATQVLSAMVTRFGQAAQDVGLAAGARRLGRSEYDVVTLASIVQREGRLISDYPKIAEVFLNRLHDNMRLDSDATLYYVLGAGHGPLTASDLALNSPYNTRLNKGLPPTPINSPGQAALEAVLHHATGPYLYFVTIDQAGHTAFATTLSQFNHLVAQSRANGVS
jgi:UPF0755 protein